MVRERTAIGDLKERVQRLEGQIQMLMHLVDSDKYPFMYLALESGLNMSQVDQILSLMDEVGKAIFTGKKPMSHSEFEKKVYEIVPTARGDYHFAESIVRSLNEIGQYTEVYRHMKKSGMNLR